ncbi:MAG: hypothetical protein GY756_14360 [bacterium]|nr:hypothetical protein [bacterium]
MVCCECERTIEKGICTNAQNLHFCSYNCEDKYYDRKSTGAKYFLSRELAAILLGTAAENINSCYLWHLEKNFSTEKLIEAWEWQNDIMKNNYNFLTNMGDVRKADWIIENIFPTAAHRKYQC